MEKTKDEEKIYKIVKCKKYANQATIGHLVSYGIWVATIFTSNPFDQFAALAALITCSFLKGKYNEAIFKSQEFIRYKEIYQIILKKYIELNKRLNLNNPLEIYALFDFAIKNSLFSLETERICISSKKFDRPLIRELTLNNHGVCRHIASMLTDVYLQMGIESSICVCAKPEMVETLEDLNEQDKEVFQEMTKHMNEVLGLEKDGKSFDFNELLKAAPKKIVLQQKPLTKKDIKYGNHAITLVNDDNFTYYLDPTNSNYYIPTEEENEIISDEGIKSIINPLSTSIHNSKFGIKEIDIKPSQEDPIIFEQLIKTEQTIMTNMDMIKNFRKEIKEYLEEAEEIYPLILK